MDYILQISINVAVLAGVYSLLALGFNLLYSHSKFFDLSYAAYMLVGAYSYLFFSSLMHGVAAFLISILFTILFSILIEKYLHKKMREKKSSSVALMISSLGVLTVTQALVAIIFTSNIQTLSAGSQSITFYNAYITYLQIFIIIISLLSYAVIYILLKRSVYGIHLRAVSDNEELAVTSGIDINKVHLITTALASSLGCIVVILYGMDTSIDPYMGMSLLLKGVVVAIIGGLGRIMYGLYAALLLSIIETCAIWYIGGEWKDAVAFGVLILILLVRPRGIFPAPVGAGQVK